MAATRLNLEEPGGQTTPTTLIGRTKVAPTTCCGDCRYMTKTRSVRLANSWCRKRPSRRRTHRSWCGRSWGWFSHRRSNRFSYNRLRCYCFLCCWLLGYCFLCCWLLGYCFLCCRLLGYCFLCCWLLGYCFLCCRLLGYCFLCCRLLGYCFLCCWLLGYCFFNCWLLGYCFFSYWFFSGDFFSCWFGFLCCYHFELLNNDKN